MYFSAADLFAAPYISGTQSGAVKMALGFHLPVVLTNCIVDETLAERPGVWPVAEGDAEALALAIEEAFEHPVDSRAPEPQDDWDRLVRAVEKIAPAGGLEYK